MIRIPKLIKKSIYYKFCSAELAAAVLSNIINSINSIYLSWPREVSINYKCCSAELTAEVLSNIINSINSISAIFEI